MRFVGLCATIAGLPLRLLITIVRLLISSLDQYLADKLRNRKG